MRPKSTKGISLIDLIRDNKISPYPTLINGETCYHPLETIKDLPNNYKLVKRLYRTGPSSTQEILVIVEIKDEE